MFEISQQEAFGDAWKALKLVFGLDSAPDPAIEELTPSDSDKQFGT